MPDLSIQPAASLAAAARFPRDYSPYPRDGDDFPVPAGRELYADRSFDEAWLKKIFHAAGVEPTFTLRRLSADHLVAQTAAKRGATFDAYVAARDAMLAIPVHRAEPDARAWAELWRRFSH